MAVQRAGFVIDKINADTFRTYHLRVPVPLPRHCLDTFLQRGALHVPKPHWHRQHTVTVAGAVCRDSLFIGFHNWSTVPSLPYPNDIHNVHCSVCDTLGRPVGSKRTLAHVPHHLCTTLHNRPREILHRRHIEEDVPRNKIKQQENRLVLLPYTVFTSVLQESS